MQYVPITWLLITIAMLLATVPSFCDKWYLSLSLVIEFNIHLDNNDTDNSVTSASKLSNTGNISSINVCNTSIDYISNIGNISNMVTW